MNRGRIHGWGFFLACYLAAFASVGAEPRAADPRLVTGVVADATTGLGVSGAVVRFIDSAGTTVAQTTTGSSGEFSYRPIVRPVHVRVERTGYVPVDAGELDPARPPTIAIQTAPTTLADVRTIATTSVRATSSLQRSSTIYRTLAPAQLLQSGIVRFGDALRTLPGVANAIAGDTAALGDDLQLSIRGLGNGNTRTGQIETTALLDGHPIGFGAPGGFNYQLSPTFGLKAVTVQYGSAGTSQAGYDAIGGTIDSETIDPSLAPRTTVMQGGGSFDRFATNFTSTGTSGRLGYAFSLGVASLDGPLHHERTYQPGAAYDPSATAPAVRALGVYEDDGTAVSRSGVFKLRYGLSRATDLTVTSVQSSYYEDKTGNGDGDYLTPHIALLTGQGLLVNKRATDPCPAGAFTAANANGTPWGAGPGGVADGGNPCQTPQSYANDVAGPQGAGTAWQTFNFGDEAVHLQVTGARNAFSFDAFTNRYFDTVDRKFQLPYLRLPGDVGAHSNNESGATGAVAREDLVGRSNDLAFGFGYTNYAYKLQRNGSLLGAPIVRETDAFLREAYHAQGSPLSLFTSADVKYATATHRSYVDPRASVVYAASARDVVRVAAGATTAQPPANVLGTKFAQTALLAAGGGGGVNCATTNSVGTAPSALLRPERGVDEELAYGHRFGGDSQVELAFFTTDVFDKIYTTTTPLSITGTGFIDPAALAAIAQSVSAKCGGDPLALLGVSGFVNIGALRTRGFTLGGRERLSPGAFVDYDYATTSTVVRSATPQFFAQNLTIVPNAQLPRLPLHTFNVAVDGAPTSHLDVRYTLHAVGENNTKRLGAYNSSDLRLSASGLGPGVLTASVFNLFDQNAFLAGYLGEGAPLALNSYATKAQSAPYTGAGQTEKFGLPYRSLFVSYTLSIFNHR